jgi:hypothetical protein
MFHAFPAKIVLNSVDTTIPGAEFAIHGTDMTHRTVAILIGAIV